MTRAVFVLMLCAEVLQGGPNSAAEILAKAARNGDVKAIEGMLASGVDPDVPDRYGHTPLYYAVSFNQNKAVELLLAHHADPNPRAKSHTFASQVRDTPLQNAAELGNRRVAEMLIEAGAKVNEPGPSGRTALHCAYDQLEVIRLLIEKGADVNARDNEGTSAMDAAVWYGSFDTVALLLAHGARLNETEPKTGATPINEAAYKGHARLVQYLLLFKPDLGIRDKRGYSPLENAMRMGKEDCAVLLLEAESKESETPEFRARAMETAVKKDESSVVEGLLARGANANEVLPSGSTVLDAAAFGGAGKVVDVLLKNNADPNLSGKNGTSALEDAALKGFDAIVGMLLDHGAWINQVNAASGTTALYSAAAFRKGGYGELAAQAGRKPQFVREES